jgi:hypothetical protein
MAIRERMDRETPPFMDHIRRLKTIRDQEQAGRKKGENQQL